MRILIVNDYGAPFGGAERMSLSLRDGLRERGHAALLFSSDARPLPAPLEADVTCSGSVGTVRRVRQALNPSAAAGLRRLLARYEPDVVHVRMYLNQLSPVILPALEGVPSVLQIVNYDQICPLNTKTLPSGERCLVRPGRACLGECRVGVAGLARYRLQRALSDRWRGVFGRIVANSDWVRRRLSAEGVPVTDVVWNGVPERSPRGGLAGVPTVAFVGRLHAKKGVADLIRAMRIVRRSMSGARLVVVGDGPERPGLERLARDLGIGEACEFLGQLDHERMEAAVSGAWVQSVPSRWEEPFGLVAAEGMMRGTAVCVSDAGGLSEIIESGVTGEKHRPGEPADMARALTGLLTDPDRVESMGRAARSRALESLTIDRTVDRFVEIYDEVARA